MNTQTPEIPQRPNKQSTETDYSPQTLYFQTTFEDQIANKPATDGETTINSKTADLQEASVTIHRRDEYERARAK